MDAVPVDAVSVVQPDLGTSAVRKIGPQTFDFAREVAIMAIINRTRDSFYDKGRTFALSAAVEAVDAAVAAGARWVDIGGVPFSPISEPVEEQDELARVVPVIEAARKRTDVVISVDTFRARVAEQAIAAGADAINDTSGLHDPAIADVASRTGATLIVTHSKAPPRQMLPRPHYHDVVAEVKQFLLNRVDVAIGCGVAPASIIIDPGHDLNKNTRHSLELTRRMGELATLGYPMLASVSNKDFIAEALGRPFTELAEGTLATAVFCILQGARILRVHDVGSTAAAVRMVEAIMGWRPPHTMRHNVE